MRAIFLVSAALLLTGSGDVDAKDLSRQITALGPAGQSCSTWSHERQKLQRARSWSSDLKFMSAWITGYLTGSNEAMVARGEQDALLTMHADLPAAFAWIDDYCHAQPINSIYDASAALMSKLRKDTDKQRSAN